MRLLIVPRYVRIEAGSKRIRLQAPAILWHAEEAAGHILNPQMQKRLLFPLKGDIASIRGIINRRVCSVCSAHNQGLCRYCSNMELHLQS